MISVSTVRSHRFERIPKFVGCIDETLAMDRNDDMLPYIEAFLAVHMMRWQKMHWQNTDGIRVVPDWKAAGINPLPGSVDSGVTTITADTVGQFKHA